MERKLDYTRRRGEGLVSIVEQDKWNGSIHEISLSDAVPPSVTGLLLLQLAHFLQHRLQSFGESSGIQFVCPLTILQKNNK